MISDMSPKAILFDWDNTLIDTIPCVHACINAVFDELGMPHWSMAEVHEKSQRSAREYFPELFGDQWRDVMKQFYHHYETKHLEQLKLIDGSLELVQYAQSINIPMGIVSNKTSHFLKAEIDHLNWGSYFKAIVGSGDCALDKPAPDPIYRALELMNISASSNIWFIGDTPNDIICALSAGCIPIYVDHSVITLNDVKKKLS
jgi:phosphoglycolate phosphatase